MRSVTVDTKGLFGTIKLLGPVIIFFALWYAWLPMQQELEPQEQLAGVRSTYANTSAVAESVIPHTGKYVYINISNGQVVLYNDDDVFRRLEIQHTPSMSASLVVPQGTYTVDKKIETELSTIALMHFPYYMQFGDVYAMHGTPRRVQDGELEEAYSGGKIELTTTDAEIVFEFVEIGTPVQVTIGDVGYAKQPGQETTYFATDEKPATSALSYALCDMSTGETYLLKNGNKQFPIASITKLITAVVATDLIGHGTEVKAPNAEYYTLSELYYPLFLRSDNAVAERIAQHVGMNYFLSNMNGYVRTLGMTRSHFSDTSGLSPKNTSTANDLVRLAQHLYDDKSFILDITKEEDMTITSKNGYSWSVTNQNKLASDPYFRGGKLGYTDEAGQTSLAIFNVPIQGVVHPVAVVILQSRDWKQDTRTLLRWLVESTKEESLQG